MNGNGAKVPTVKKCGLDVWLTGTRLRELQDEWGQQQFRRWMSKRSNGNAARYLKRYSDFLQPSQDSLVTTDSLYETYRESVTRQLAA